MTEQLGRYQLLAEIGQGGFAIVYRARDTILDRLVALKELRPVLLRDTVWVKRFQREARVIARLDHPCIVPIYDVGEAEGRSFIVMRLVDGPSLAELISAQGRLPWSEALKIITAVVEGLDYAHAQDILHRDLKPANILLDPERGPLLSDFGMAKLVGDSSISLSGNVVGTPHYIAPEGWEGGTATPQVDIYALGCILYEMLVGMKIFQGETPLAVMRAHLRPLEFPTTWPEGVPSGVAEVLRTALARQPANRYATAKKMAEELTALTKPAPTRLDEPPGVVQEKSQDIDNLLEIFTCGGLQLRCGGEPITNIGSRRVEAVLIHLACTRRAQPREVLADMLWDDRPQRRAMSNLRTVLTGLRQHFGPYVFITRDAVALNPEGNVWLDVAELTENLAVLPSQGGLDSAELAAQVAEAVALYQGDFLEGFHLRGALGFEEWLTVERENLRQQVLDALSGLVVYHLAQGSYKAGIIHAQRLLQLDPLLEEVHQQLMHMLAYSGQRAAALAQYETCRRMLAEEFGIEPLPETTALFQRIRAARSRPRCHNLPPQPTACVGRETELAQIHQALADPTRRLLTIIGPGGIGKTRLALEAATAQVDLFLEGVTFVPLAGLDEVSSLVPAIASALNFSFSGSENPRIQLLNYLRSKEMLLVLDSFEHLLDGAGLLTDILEAAPEMKLLVTSRERLNLRWELLLPLGGLSYPENGATEAPETYGAALMFLQSGRRVWPDFSVSKANRADVVSICQLVEGMPLAIDLAAAWVRVLSCTDIAREIAHGLDILTTSQRDVPERHRSLHAVFEHSWQLLTPPEQQVFAKLSVFRGGFQREAAGQVADASLSVLTSLVDSSLLRMSPSGRYEMHELLRQYGSEKLSVSPEAHTEARDQHCVFYATFLQHQEANLRGLTEAEALAMIEAEIENVHVAWRWAVRRGKINEIDISTNPLSRYYFFKGPFQKGETILKMAIDRLKVFIDKTDEPEKDLQIILSKLLSNQARLLNMQGLNDQAIATAREGIDLAQTSHVVGLEAVGYQQWGTALHRLGDHEMAMTQLNQALALAQTAQLPQVESESIYELGFLHFSLGNYIKAKIYFEQAFRLSDELGDRRLQSGVLNGLGNISWQQGSFVKAKAYFEQTLRLGCEIGDRWREANALLSLGNISNEQGDYIAAREYFEQALHICRETGSRYTEGGVLNNLGLNYRFLGDYDRAKAFFDQALLIHRETGNRYGTGVVLSNLSVITHHQGNNEAALRYAQKVLQIGQDLSASYLQGFGLTFLGNALMALGHLVEAAEAYQQALNLRYESGTPHLAMESLAGLARISLARGDLIRAQAQVEEILEFLESNSMDGTDEPFRVYLTCYQVLRDNQDPRAIEILNIAHNLLQERAAKISDEKLRRSFLENVPTHREILKEFANCG